MHTVSTRRAILAGAAAVPPLSLPAIADEDDPIFAAIESHRIAEAAFAASCSDEQLNTNGRKSWKLYGALLATEPLPWPAVQLCYVISRHTKKVMIGPCMGIAANPFARPAIASCRV
ncbi:MAG TPA: hypothetical protein VGQ63_15725 [Pseudolabrys sp.]|jgi:hypothetical protein|nr:hypothetical protein [Pseudolabrys sp.]